jgi:hypothetical protein
MILIDGFEHLNLINHQDHIIENDIEEGAAMAQTSYEEISEAKIEAGKSSIPRLLV